MGDGYVQNEKNPENLKRNKQKKEEKTDKKKRKEIEKKYALSSTPPRHLLLDAERCGYSVFTELDPMYREE